LRSIVVQDRADAAILGEQRIAPVAEHIQLELLVGFLPAVALEFDPAAVLKEQGTERRLAQHVA
jgi:hypothetical protein